MGDQLLTNLGLLAKAIVPFVVGSLSVLMGLWILFRAGQAMFLMGESRQQDPGAGPLTWGRVAAQALIAVMLLRYSTTMQEMSELLVAGPIEEPFAAMAYFPAAQGMGKWTEAVKVALLWVVTLGWIFGLRGLLQWNKAASGGGSAGQNGDLMWAGFWHLIGGAAMVNLAAVIRSFFG